MGFLISPGWGEAWPWCCLLADTIQPLGGHGIADRCTGAVVSALQNAIGLAGAGIRGHGIRGGMADPVHPIADWPTKHRHQRFDLILWRSMPPEPVHQASIAGVMGMLFPS